MRVLVEDPAELPEARYRELLLRAQVEGLLADHLVLGEPYLALNAVVLEPDEDARLRWATTALASALHKAGQALCRDVPQLVELGFPWAAAQLLAVETPRHPVVGRFDFAQDRDGCWWLLEYNADTPSGVREAVVGDRLVRELAPGGAELGLPNAGLADQLADAFDAAVPDGPALGVITSTAELEDLCQAEFTAALLRPRLAKRGIEVLVGDGRAPFGARSGAFGARSDPSEARSGLRSTARGARLDGRAIHALYRLLPFETTLGTPTFAAIFDAVAAGRLRLLNGLYGLLLQHKGLMAWLWANRRDAGLTAEERAAVEAHLPPTWLIEDTPGDECRGGLVAKQFFGREGEEVHFGAELSDDDWRELVRRRTYVAQRRIVTLELEAAVFGSIGGERWRGHATVGPFTIDGAWGGYYTRFGPRVITNRSKWIATLAA
jgi:glutathionylspermidine synthase